MPSTKRKIVHPTEESPKIAKKTKTSDEVPTPTSTQAKIPNSVYEQPGIVATAQAAAAVDVDPPMQKLLASLAIQSAEGRNIPQPTVLYWMRMEDLRITDNRALSLASECARRISAPLICLFAFNPGDYKAHDRSPRRIDFTIRNLRILRRAMAKLNIPLYTIVHSGSRKAIPEVVMSVMIEHDVTHLFANIEYEVDELRRDIKIVALASEAKILCKFVHDKLVVEPGRVKTKEDKDYSVYSPWLKNWTSIVQSDPQYLAEAAFPSPNDKSIRQHPKLALLFETEIPDSIAGFECHDGAKMDELWPAGYTKAVEILSKFLQTKARSSQLGDSSPLVEGAEVVSLKAARIGQYADQRNRCDKDTSSRLSPYLAAGVISSRQCLREVMTEQGSQKLEPNKTSGPGMWIQEVAWRDFYTHVMVAFPRVSMGRPFLEKFADVFWEDDIDGRLLQAWKDGMTGYPVIDAAMRQCKIHGWMPNRMRMAAASFLTKDLILDWRLGERHFMQNFIDGDLASNNGGWQWCASTGTDPQPWFRVFNPTLQGEKADPSGDYVRHFVPELRKLRGKAVHDPFHHLSKSAFRKLGYPEPIIEHAFARDRAIRRFKNVGEA